MTTEIRRPPATPRAGMAEVVPLFATAPLDAPATANSEGDGLGQMHAYWSGLCCDGVPPTRSAIDPRRIRAVLHQTFILEAIAPGLARFRVAGAALADLMGMDLRGMPISSLILPEGRERFAEALDTMFRSPAELHLDLRAPGGLARPALAARMLILPLRDDFGAVTRAMGCLITAGRPGRTPRRFAPSGVRLVPLDRTRQATPIRPARPMPRPRGAAGAHLRLVHST